MIKRYYDSSDERILQKQAYVLFKEVSSGVYFVVKDRLEEFPEFVTSSTVVDTLNDEEKVAVTGKSGIYANFEITKY